MVRTGDAENACIALFERVLGSAACRRHTFDFLRGDPTPNRPRGVPLPVDAYFSEFNLVVEYMGAQHFVAHPWMDRRPGRREQRREYQERRSQVLAEHGIRLIRVRYDELAGEAVRAKLAEAGIIDHDDKVIQRTSAAIGDIRVEP